METLSTPSLGRGPTVRPASSCRRCNLGEAGSARALAARPPRALCRLFGAAQSAARGDYSDTALAGYGLWMGRRLAPAKAMQRLAPGRSSEAAAAHEVHRQSSGPGVPLAGGAGERAAGASATCRLFCRPAFPLPLFSILALCHTLQNHRRRL
jgi:hypothetical protein